MAKDVMIITKTKDYGWHLITKLSGWPITRKIKGLQTDDWGRMLDVGIRNKCQECRGHPRWDHKFTYTEEIIVLPDSSMHYWPGLWSYRILRSCHDINRESERVIMDLLWHLSSATKLGRDLDPEMTAVENSWEARPPEFAWEEIRTLDSQWL